MSFFIRILCVFAIGCSFGWILEVIFRRFWSGNNSAKRWVNPGYLKGPWLPIYGFGLCILYVFCSALTVKTSSGIILVSVLILLMSSAMTVIEFLAGVISERLLHATLWDYSDEWGNIGGLICPRFSFFWALLSASYYFFLHSPLSSFIDRISTRRPILAISILYLCAVVFDAIFSLKRSLATS